MATRSNDEFEREVMRPYGETGRGWQATTDPRLTNGRAAQPPSRMVLPCEVSWNVAT